MSAIDFPNAPTDGQEFNAAGRRWRYDAAKNRWNGISVGEGAVEGVFASVTDNAVTASSSGSGNGIYGYSVSGAGGAFTSISGYGMSASSGSSTGGIFETVDGLYHVQFGAGQDFMTVERVGLAIVWFFTNGELYSGRLRPDTLTGDCEWLLPPRSGELALSGELFHPYRRTPATRPALNRGMNGVGRFPNLTPISLTAADYTKGFHCVSHKTTSAPTITCRSSTGYAIALRWDGALGVKTGTGNPATVLTPPFGTAPAVPYSTAYSKYFGVFPCDVNGVITGDLLVVTVATNSSVTEVDVSGLSELTDLTLSSNLIEYIDISGCESLTTLTLTANPIWEIYSSVPTSVTTLLLGAPGMRSFVAGSLFPALTSLTIAGSVYLATVDLDGTAVTTLTLSSTHSALASLTLPDSLITLTAGELTILTSLILGAAVTSATITNSPALATLNLSGASSLTALSLGTNNLTSLTASAALTNLTISGAGEGLVTLTLTAAINLAALSITSLGLATLVVPVSVASLTISNCDLLTSLTIAGCPLTTLTVTGCALLSSLVAPTTCLYLVASSNAALTTLTTAGCNSLNSLSADFCPLLTTVDVSGSSSLTALYLNDSGVTSFVGCPSTGASITMSFSRTPIVSLDISGYSAWMQVSVSEMPYLTSLSFHDELTATGTCYLSGTALNEAGLQSVVNALPPTISGTPTLDISFDADCTNVDISSLAAGWTVDGPIGGA